MVDTRNRSPRQVDGAAAPTRRLPAPLPFPHLPGLDGLRALAVLAVLLYHADLGWLRGGFLGVEVFFVISGYLITGLLLAEWRRAGRIDLRRFWVRRARRLLPALYTLLLVVLIYAVLFLPQEVARLRGDALAAFGYVTNWYLALRQQSYFEAAGRPSLLRHLWSLAIEEQFYLLWPPLLVFALRRWSPRRIMAGALALALGSTLLLALLYRPGVDPSALYYRTDTRLGGLLIGAALACAWQPWARLSRVRGQQVWYEVAGGSAIGLLAIACVAFSDATPFLYRGGFLLVALAAAVAIAAVVAPPGYRLAALLNWGPLRWAGTRSYSLYLWHWPIYMITRPRIDLTLDGLPLLALRLALTAVLAEWSYRCIERTVRAGLLGRAWGQVRAAQGSMQLIWRVYLVASVLLLGVLGTAVATAHAPTQDTPSAVVIDSPPEAGQSTAGEPPTATGEPTASAEPEADTGAATAPGVPIASSPVVAQPVARPFKPASKVTAIGDSVMAGVAGPLDTAITGQLYLDAAVGRQPSEGIAILEALKAQGRLGQVVIVHLGNNGYITDDEFASMMETLKDVPLVVVVTVRVPRQWEAANNRVLAGARQYPNAVLIDWFGLTNDHPEYFRDDGIHPNEIGQELYARMIAKWANEPIVPAEVGEKPPG